jgi:hypothetical protein
VGLPKAARDYSGGGGAGVPDTCSQCGANSIEPSSGGAADGLGGGASGEGSGTSAGVGAGTGGVAGGSCRRVGVVGLCCALLRAREPRAPRDETLPSAASARRRPPPPDTIHPRRGRSRAVRRPDLGSAFEVSAASPSRAAEASTCGRPTSAGSGGGAGGVSKLGATRSASRAPAAATSINPARDQRIRTRIPAQAQNTEMSPPRRWLDRLGTPPNGLCFFGNPISDGPARSTEKVERGGVPNRSQPPLFVRASQGPGVV